METVIDGWISSNASDDALWHVAVRVEARGPSGKLYGTSWVTRCSGRQLGGPYGETRRKELEGERVCSRCQKLVGR